MPPNPGRAGQVRGRRESQAITPLHAKCVCVSFIGKLGRGLEGMKTYFTDWAGLAEYLFYREAVDSQSRYVVLNHCGRLAHFGIH